MTEHRLPTYLRGRVVTPNAVIDDGVVVVEADVIAWVGRADAARGSGWPGAPGAGAMASWSPHSARMMSRAALSMSSTRSPVDSKRSRRCASTTASTPATAFLSAEIGTLASSSTARRRPCSTTTVSSADPTPTPIPVAAAPTPVRVAIVINPPIIPPAQRPRVCR